MFVIFRVITIHEKLSNLVQIAEISLPSAPEVTSNESESEIEEKEEKPIDAEMEVSYQIMEITLLLLERYHHTH